MGFEYGLTLFGLHVNYPIGSDRPPWPAGKFRISEKGTKYTEKFWENMGNPDPDYSQMNAGEKNFSAYLHLITKPTYLLKLVAPCLGQINMLYFY